MASLVEKLVLLLSLLSSVFAQVKSLALKLWGPTEEIV